MKQQTMNNKQNIMRWAKIAAMVVVCMAIFLIVPRENVTSKYMMKVINEGMVYFIAVLGLSVMLGMGGQVTFSTAAIMGVGAYISAYLTTKFDVDPLLTVLLSMIIGGIFSYLLGLALFRLKGSYFSFASIGLAQLLYTIYTNWAQVTGGADGIRNIPQLDLHFFRCENYYDYFKVYFIVAVICFFIVDRIRKTYFGRALASVRDNEINAKCMGINTYRTKVLSFLIAGVLASLAGSMYALLERYISPDPFKYDQSAIYLIMVMLGGVESTFGAFLGTMLLTFLPEKLRFLQSYYKLVYGVGVIFLMIVMPMGLMGIYDNIKYMIHGRIKKRKAAQDAAGGAAAQEGGED